MTGIRKDLKSFEDLYKTGTEIKEEQESAKASEGIAIVQISKLKPFSKHPFKMYSQEKMSELSESVKRYGVIVPILIRPIEDDKYEYEIIAGHNRVQASRLAELDEIPCNVRKLDDETAIILMVDTNLQQREIILPSEKAYAYKYKLDAMKVKGKRNDLTSSQVAMRLQSDEILAKNSNENKYTIYRFIRLTKLIPELLDKVDERKISFIPAVEISYLSTEEQKNLFDILQKEERYNIPLKQASMLKAISQKGNLTYAKIDKIITDKIKQPPSKVKISYKKIKDYFPVNITPKQLEKSIVEALDLWTKSKKESA